LRLYKKFWIASSAGAFSRYVKKNDSRGEEQEWHATR
jgi:hypothetical protein